MKDLRNRTAKVHALCAQFATSKRSSTKSRVTNHVVHEACAGHLLTPSLVFECIKIGRDKVLGSRWDPYRKYTCKSAVCKVMSRDASLIYGWFVLNSINPKSMKRAYKSVLAIQKGPHIGDPKEVARLKVQQDLRRQRALNGHCF